MLKNRNKQFALLALLFVVGPGVHFFASGANHLVPALRAYLVGIQLAFGTGISVFFWFKRENTEKRGG